MTLLSHCCCSADEVLLRFCQCCKVQSWKEDAVLMSEQQKLLQVVGCGHFGHTLTAVSIAAGDSCIGNPNAVQESKVKQSNMDLASA